MHTDPRILEAELTLIALTSLLDKGLISRLQFESDVAELNFLSGVRNADPASLVVALDNLLSPPVVGGE